MVVRLGSAIIVLALYFWNPYPFQLLELKSFDWLMMSQKPIQNENSINTKNNPKCLLIKNREGKISRNERCEATGKKFKHCCGAL